MVLRQQQQHAEDRQEQLLNEIEALSSKIGTIFDDILVLPLSGAIDSTLAGSGPDIAQTIVQHGIDLRDLGTCSNL